MAKSEPPKSEPPPAGRSARSGRALQPPENRRETGARKLEKRPGGRANPVHTGDRGDEPPGSRRGENPDAPSES